MPHWFSLATSSIVERMKGILEMAATAPRTTRSSVDRTRRIHEETRSRIFETTGLVLEGKRGLDIGPDRRLGCLRCFSLSNDVVGIDADVAPEGLDLVGYALMLRHDADRRRLKALAEKALGRDFRFRWTLARELGIDKVPSPRVLRMSTEHMDFADESFDFVYSHSAFEHIADPTAALLEAARVLRPGGVAYISVHPFTSHSGSHEPGSFAEARRRPPYWPHLRPSLAAASGSRPLLNRLSLGEWRTLFGRVMPGAALTERRDDEHLVQALKTLRAWGELASYSDEELLTVELSATWQKTRADEAPVSEGPITEASRLGVSGIRQAPCA